MSMPAALGEAIAKTVRDSGLFSMLGLTGAELHVEHTDGRPRVWIDGASGRFVAALEGMDVIAAHEGSTRVAYSFDCVCALFDVNAAQGARGAFMHDFAAAFADGGTALFAALDDPAQARLGKSGLVTVQPSVRANTEDPDRPVDVIGLRIELWQRQS